MGGFDQGLPLANMLVHFLVELGSLAQDAKFPEEEGKSKERIGKLAKRQKNKA